VTFIIDEQLNFKLKQLENRIRGLAPSYQRHHRSGGEILQSPESQESSTGAISTPGPATGGTHCVCVLERC